MHVADGNALKKRMLGFHIRYTCYLAIAALCAGTPTARAQASATLEVFTRQTYVGTTINAGIKISGAREHEKPQFPDLPDCEVSEVGSSSLEQVKMDSTTGKLVREESITYNYVITPGKAGTLTIPGIPVHVDGQTLVTQPVQIEVRQPPKSRAPGGKNVLDADEADELLLAEITCNEKQLYVGQTAEFTLTIWVKAAQYDGRPLSCSDMIQLIRGNFEPFDVKQLSTDHAYRKLARGDENLYCIVRMPADYMVKQTGALAFDDVSIGVDYPTRFQRDRFFGNLQVVGSQPIRIQPLVNVPEVQPLPTENRPADFNGIVGHYEISAMAVPTKVHVGDPITLHVEITGYPVDTLPPPDLKDNEEMDRDFRFPDEPMVGTVNGRTKRFVQTIRAKNADVGWIPAIEFPYFDPQRGEYVVAKTERLPLLVEQVDELDAGDLTNITAESPQSQASGVELRDGLRGNITAESALLATVPRITQSHVLLAVFVPFVGFLCVIGLLGILRHGRNEALQRRKGALRAAEKRIVAAQADQLSAADFHGEIAAALGGYLADRFNEPPARFVGEAALEFLRTRRAADELVRQWSDVQRRCEEAAYAGGATKDEGLTEAALLCLRKIEGVKL